jgi:signal transduction histidine kinase
MVTDIAEDFTLLAQEEGRTVNLPPMSPSPVLADSVYARQILHNFFTNALKHGQGEIRVKLQPGNDSHLLTITNRLRPGRKDLETLGLGLRVVDTLLSLQPAIKCRRRQNRNCYGVRIAFPVGRDTTRPRELTSKQESVSPDWKI